ncbi:MAG: serine/threonine-protein kinase [Bacteroidota bacterium]
MNTHILPTGYLLDRKRFEIKKMIGQGGFGITYLGHDRRLDKKVAIKELYLQDYAVRSAAHEVVVEHFPEEEYVQAKARFLREARSLQHFDNPSIIKVLDVFEENNTAYLVMDYVAGKTLQAWVSEHGKPPISLLNSWLAQLNIALSSIHAKNIYHLDIKPDNLMIRDKDQSIVLIDFGLCKELEASGKLDLSQLAYSQHYSAPELREGTYQKYGQYAKMDVYSLAATLYYTLTGQKPISDFDEMRREMISKNIEEQSQQAILSALSISPHERPESVAELIKSTRIFKDSEDTVFVPSTATPQPQNTESEASWSRKYGYVILILVLLLAGFWFGKQYFPNLTGGKNSTITRVDTTEQKEEPKPPVSNTGSLANGNKTETDQMTSDSPSKTEEDRSNTSSRRDETGDTATSKSESTVKTTFIGSINRLPSPSNPFTNYSLSINLNGKLEGNLSGICRVLDPNNAENYVDLKVRGSYDNERKRLQIRTVNVVKQKGFSFCNFSFEGYFDPQRANQINIKIKTIGSDNNCKGFSPIDTEIRLNIN